MIDSKQWFNEVYAAEGSVFGLKIKQKLAQEQTDYQLIEIYETEKFGNLMVIDGCVMLTSRDNFLYHEMMSHPAVFSHPDPKDVVIIGGGDCGTLKEVLKHSEVKSVRQIDIDEQVTRLSEKYFPELCEANNDPRAELLFIDGVKWVKDSPSESVDIMIIDSTDPVGPGEGLFTDQFYAECFRILKPNGIIVHQSESPLFHLDSIIKPMHDNFKQAGFNQSITMQFPQPCYPSGWWTATMAVKNGDLNNFRISDAENKIFKTKYYNSKIHQAAMVQPEMMEEIL